MPRAVTHNLDGMTPNVVVNQADDSSSNRTQLKAQVGTTNDFVNNAYNNLVRRRLDADGAGGGAFTEKLWIYDGDEAILEFASSTATAPSHRYLWGPAVDQILADEQVATGSPNDVRWPLADWQGTVRDVATYNAATNVTTIANHKVYEAFGKVFSESGPTVDTIFGYTGRFFDDDTGLQWNTNRWYDPGVGPPFAPPGLKQSLSVLTPGAYAPGYGRSPLRATP